MSQTVPLPRIAPKSVSILGATGSVGLNTMDLIARDPGRYRVEALTANQNVEELISAVRRVKPRLAVIGDPGKYQILRDALAGSGTEAAAGRDAVIEAASRPADWIMAAIVGAAGLAPTLAAVAQGTTVAIANKECLVCAGDHMMDVVRREGTTLLPVDSEHNAIFQVFDSQRPKAVEKITLTASGGPFRTASLAQMKVATPAQAIAHPNWQMGAKISVDCATYMNKGLELIEAYHLFPVEKDQIDVVVHPQSVIHSMVSYSDGSVLAQMASPDMRTPIAYALGWPDRIHAPVARLDLVQIGQLTFEAPDFGRFPALRLAKEALAMGGGAPAVLNAANEIAVEAFLKGKIGFLDIARIVEKTLEAGGNRGMGQWGRPLSSLEDMYAADEAARAYARELLELNWAE
ncbi:MAG TPA: 1-deoxy-D-xylulose-5-phosphate reductoisomerase [Alphaproteobacteria bacterium]|nr:1-deoxy-D-xylulose-5-phosphate reductoisomerase [Alphaproteobacteria bacterium]